MVKITMALLQCGTSAVWYICR